MYARWNVAAVRHLLLHMHDISVLLFAETLPEHSDHYYGFTQYAIELNELTDDLAETLPICDTRFRPDQRYVIHIEFSSP